MIWLVDARDLSGHFSVGMTYGLASIDPISYHIRWWSSSKLLQRWSVATKPVYFDIHSEDNSNLLRLMKFDSDENAGILSPIGSDTLVNAALNGDPLPLCGVMNRMQSATVGTGSWLTFPELAIEAGRDP